MRIRKLDIVAAVALLGFVVALPAPSTAVGPEPPTAQPTAKPAPAGSTKAVKQRRKPKAKAQRQSELNGLEDYRVAYDLIYTRHDYAAGIDRLHALGQDDNADVANLLGYASRKLGRYDDAKSWYDKALAADPRHTLTWSYYGAWHAEQGNLLKARDYLAKVRSICGTECREYTLLKGVIDGTAIY